MNIDVDQECLALMTELRLQDLRDLTRGRHAIDRSRDLGVNLLTENRIQRIDIVQTRP